MTYFSLKERVAHRWGRDTFLCCSPSPMLTLHDPLSVMLHTVAHIWHESSTMRSKKHFLLPIKLSSSCGPTMRSRIGRELANPLPLELSAPSSGSAAVPSITTVEQRHQCLTLWEADGTFLCGGRRSCGMHISSACSSLAVRIHWMGRRSVCACVFMYTELKDIKAEAQVASDALHSISTSPYSIQDLFV